MKNNKKIVIIAIFICIFVVLALIFFNRTSINHFFMRRNLFNGEIEQRNVKPVNNPSEINDKLDILLEGIDSVAAPVYNIEDENIARADYVIEKMQYTLRASSDASKSLSNLEHNWGSPILMVCECDDGAEVDVDAQVSLDDYKVMKADWYDNDLYYSMTTKNLTSREEFLQEVNRIVLSNHISFY